MISQDLVEIRGDTVHLNFHYGQWQAWDSLKRFVYIISGTQGGKTSFGPWWLWREIQACGHGDYIAGTSSYDLFKLKMLPEIRDVFENRLGIGRYWAGDKIIEICDPERRFWANRIDDPMWARIILRSASAESGLEATTARAAWLDELGQDEFTLQAYEAVLRRLALNMGRLLGTTTPYNMGWLYQIVYQAWLRGAPDIDVINFPSTANPRFPREEFQRMQDTTAEWKFNMFGLGIFERPQGLIYRDFIDDYADKGGHKVHPFPLPIEWPRVVGVDPGGVNLAMVWLAHDTENNLWYAYRENKPGPMTTKEYVTDALELAKQNKERIIRWYIGAKSETQQRKDFSSYGARPALEPPITDVESGIDRIIGLLKQHRLLVFDTCTGLLDQFGRYRRKLDTQDNPVEAIQDKEKFHFLDALRYGGAAADIPKAKVYR